MHRCSATVKAGSALVNAQSQTVVFVGVPSPSVFRSALAAASSSSIAAAGSCYVHLPPLPLPPPYHLRDPIPSGNVSAPGALISNSSAAVIGVVDSLKLTSHSTFGHILSESGASRLFACTSAGASASATDFTVNCSGSPQVLRAGRSAHPALFPAPASIIIAVADKSNALPALAPLTPAAAAFFYLAGRFAVVADAAQACVSSPLFVCIFSNICPLPPPSLCSTLTI